jgi:hypothetical protein
MPPDSTTGDVQDAPGATRETLDPAPSASSAPFPLDLVLIGAGLRIVAKSLARGLFGWKRYPGDAPSICERVIEDCWNGRFFAGSAGHFSQFWTRDLAMCTPALCRLGHGDRVRASWAWGLDRFEAAGRITTTIFGRHPRDVYDFGADSLPLLLYGLHECGAEDLVHRHRGLLAREIDRYIERVFDPEQGLARAVGYFSGPRDCITGRSTVFANTMLALLRKLIDAHGGLFVNRLRPYDLEGALRAHYWRGTFFRDSLDREIPSGDANVWPFYFGVCEDQAMRRAALQTLEQQSFTAPIPLRYFEHRLPDAELPVPRFFTPNYQGDTSWMQMGPAFLHVLAAEDRPRMLEHRARVAAFIERDGNFLEVYQKDGRPYRGRAGLYQTDEGMIWAAMFLALY